MKKIKSLLILMAITVVAAIPVFAGMTGVMTTTSTTDVTVTDPLDLDYGNVDGNEKGIETKDAILVLKYLSNKTEYPLTEKQLLIANVDGNFEADGVTPKVDTKDAIWILKYLADKKNVIFPVLQNKQ